MSVSVFSIVLSIILLFILWQSIILLFILSIILLFKVFKVNNEGKKKNFTAEEVKAVLHDLQRCYSIYLEPSKPLVYIEGYISNYKKLKAIFEHISLTIDKKYEDIVDNADKPLIDIVDDADKPLIALLHNCTITDIKSLRAKGKNFRIETDLSYDKYKEIERDFEGIGIYFPQYYEIKERWFQDDAHCTVN